MQKGFRRNTFVTSFKAFHTQVIEQTLVELVENTIKFLTTVREMQAAECSIVRYTVAQFAKRIPTVIKETRTNL